MHWPCDFFFLNRCLNHFVEESGWFSLAVSHVAQKNRENLQSLAMLCDPFLPVGLFDPVLSLWIPSSWWSRAVCAEQLSPWDLGFRRHNRVVVLCAVLINNNYLHRFFFPRKFSFAFTLITNLFLNGDISNSSNSLDYFFQKSSWPQNNFILDNGIVLMEYKQMASSPSWWSDCKIMAEIYRDLTKIWLRNNLSLVLFLSSQFEFQEKLSCIKYFM